MKIDIYANVKASHQVQAAAAIRAGLKKHGINAETKSLEDYQPADLVIFWGHRQKTLIANQLANGADYLVIERGYIGDRMNWYSLGFNGLNGHAEFVKSDDTRRGESFRLLVNAWNPEGDYYLICGQVLGDASLTGVDYPAWVYSLPTEHQGKPVYFRPHPVGFSYRVKHKILSGDLRTALKGAAQVWIWNSNSGVDALLAGTPVVAFDRGAMCWDYAEKTLGCPPKAQPVQQMVNELAWCQWTLEEMANGTAWEHLKKRYD